MSTPNLDDFPTAAPLVLKSAGWVRCEDPGCRCGGLWASPEELAREHGVYVNINRGYLCTLEEAWARYHATQFAPT